MPSSFYHLYEKLKNSSGGASGTSNAPSNSTPISVTTPLGVYSRPGLVLPGTTTPANPVNAIATPLGIYTNSMLFPVPGIRATPASASGTQVDSTNPRQINSLYDVLAHTWTTLSATSIRNNYIKNIHKNPVEEYYIKKYGLDSYFRNIGGTEYTWDKNKQVWKDFFKTHITQPYKMLTDESVPFRTRMSSYGAHLLTVGLTGFGETADIYANIVKAALPNKITHWEEKYPELKGTTTFERIIAGIYGIDVAKDPILGVASDDRILFALRKHTPEEFDEYYKNLSKTMRERNVRSNIPFSRYSFDWDLDLDNNPDKKNVGEAILDVVGEFFTDPLNVLEIGGTIADAVGGNKALLKALTKNGDDVYNRALPELIESGVLKWDANTAKWFNDLLDKGKIDFDTYAAFKRIGFNSAQAGDKALVAKSFSDVLLKKNNPNKGIFNRIGAIANKGALRDALYGTNRNEFIDAFKAYMGSQNYSESTLRILARNDGAIANLGGHLYDVLEKALVHKTNFKILAGIHGLAEGADLLDGAIIKLAGMPVATPVVALIKKFGGKFIRYIGSSTVKAFEKHRLIRNGIDLGEDLTASYDDILKLVQENIKGLKLANAGDAIIDSAEAAEEMMAEAAARSLNAQTAFFNTVFNNMMKKYANLAFDDPDEYAKRMQDIVDLCQLFINKADGDKAIQLTDVRDFIAYLDDLMVKHPQLKLAISSNTLQSLEKIALLEELAESAGKIGTADAFKYNLQNLFVPDTKMTVDDLFDNARKVIGQELYGIDRTIKSSSYLIGEHPQVIDTIKDADVDKLVKSEITPENIDFVKQFFKVKNALETIISRFDYDYINGGLRSGVKSDLMKLGNTKRIHETIAAIENDFDILKKTYDDLTNLINDISEKVPEKIITETDRIPAFLSPIKAYYEQLYESLNAFMHNYDDIIFRHHRIEDALNKTKQDTIGKMVMFSVTSQPYASAANAFKAITELFANPIFTKQHGIPEDLYKMTISQIRNSAFASEIIPNVDNFIQRTTELINNIDTLINNHPELKEYFSGAEKKPLESIIEYIKSYGDIDFQNMEFKKFQDFVSDIDKQISDVEDILRSVQESPNTTIKSAIQQTKIVDELGHFKASLSKTTDPNKILRMFDFGYVDFSNIDIIDKTEYGTYNRFKKAMEFFDASPELQRFLKEDVTIASLGGDAYINKIREFLKKADEYISSAAQKSGKKFKSPLTPDELFIATGTLRNAINLAIEKFNFKEETIRKIARFGDFKDLKEHNIWERFVLGNDWSKSVFHISDNAPAKVVIPPSYYSDLKNIQDEPLKGFRQAVLQTQRLFTSELPFYSDLDSTKAWVKLRNERMSELVYTMHSTLASVMDNLKQGTGDAGILFKQLLQDKQFEESQTALVHAIRNVYNWLASRDFVQGVLSDASLKLTPKTSLAFFETLMNFSQNNIELLSDTRYQYAFYNKMCMNLDSKYSPRRASLDAFRKSDFMDQVPDKFKERIMTKGHMDPGSDTLALKYKTLLDDSAGSVKEQTELYLKNHPKRQAKFFDIETVYDSNNAVMTANKNSGRITQLALTDYVDDTQAGTVVYRLRVGSDGKPIDYGEPAKGAIYKYYDTPTELFLAFDNDLAKTDILIGMNSRKFDVPFIRDKFAAENLEFFKGSEFQRILRNREGGHYDVYHAVQLFNGVLPESTELDDFEAIQVLLNRLANEGPKNGISKLSLLDSYEFEQATLNLDYAIQDILKDKTALKQFGTNGDILKDFEKELSEHIKTFKENLMRTSFNDLLYRDLTKETVTRAKIDELVEISKMKDHPEVIYKMLKDEAHLTDKEFNILLNDDVTDKLYTHVQDKVKDAWVRRMYYLGNKDFVNTKLTYEEWQKVFNMHDPRSLQRVLMDPDGHLPINIRRVYTPGGFDIVKNGMGERLSIYDIDMIKQLLKETDEKTLMSLQNAFKRLNDITERRIKQPEAILNGELGKIFTSKQNLKNQTEHLINILRTNPNGPVWTRFINLKTFDEIDTVEHWFALWYMAATDIRARAIPEIQKIFETLAGFTPMHITMQEALDSIIKMAPMDDEELLKVISELTDPEVAVRKFIQDNVFETITETVFDNKDVAYLLDDESMLSHPLYDLFNTDVWQSYTGAQRLQKASVAIDYIGKGGAKEYARAALMQDFRSIISYINKLPQEQQLAYVQAFAKQINDITGILNMKFLATALNEEAGANAILSDLLYLNGVRIFHIDPQLPDTEYSRLCKELLNRKDIYKNAGIQIDYDKKTSCIYLRLAKNDISVDSETGIISYGGRSIAPPSNPVARMTDPSGVIPEEHLQFYTTAMGKIAFNGADPNLETFPGRKLVQGNYLGQSLNQENFKVWIDENIPKSLKYHETSLDLEKLSTRNFYHGTNLRMCNVYDPASILSKDQPAYSQTVHNFFNSYRHMLNTELGQDLFFDFMFSPTYGMCLKNTEGIFKGLSEEEILQVIKNTDDYVPLGIVKDNSIQGFHVVRLQINSVKDVRRAGELNAMLVPYQVYSSCFEEINNTLEAAFNKPVTKHGKQLLENKGIMAYVKSKPLYYARLGLWMYKVGSLISPGTILRNLIDSNLKAAIDTGDPIATIRNNIRAIDMMHRYNETIKLFMEPTIFDSPRSVTPSMLREAYEKFAKFGYTPKMSQDEFLFLHSFIINGPSTGETKVLRDWFSSASDLAKSEGSGFLQRFADTMLQPMGWVETHARLGQYLTLMEQGITKTEAFTRISKTAFDYNIKSNVDKFIEYFLPFFNFQKLNAMYWAEAFYKHPKTMKFLNDFTRASWQTFEYDDGYYMSEKSKMYHMMNGNLMIDPAAGMVLKLNPSYMDALNWLYDPANSVIDSLLAPMQNYINGVMDNDAERFVQQQIKDGTYVIRVGKYKGWTVNKVLERDPGYLQFALDKEWFRTYDQAAYQSAMLKLSGTPMSITFGNKFNGQPVKVLLKDENRAYAQYLLTQPWFKDMYKPVYDYLVLNKVYENPVMPFGKFKGKAISEVPNWYFDYIMKNDWMYESYGYLADAIIEKRNTILPLQDIDFDSKATYADASGKFAAGMFIEDNEQANIYLQSILDMFNKSSTYPLVGPTIQKYITSLFKDEQGNIPFNSSSRTNYTRLSKQGTITEARIGALFPDVFGSVTLYERHKQESAIDYSKVSPHISKYRPQDYSDRRNRHYNYYRSARAERYRTYHKHVKPSLDVAQLRLNIAQLHLGV